MDSINNSSINLKERRSSNVNEERYISLLLKFSESIKNNNNRDQTKEYSNENIVKGYIETISDYIRNDDKDVTLQGLNSSIKNANSALFKAISSHKLISEGRSTITLKAVSEILIHKINKIISKNLRENFDTIKSNVVNVCSDLIEKNKISKNKIYQKFKGCMRNGMTLLVHGYSSTVFNTLKECKKQGINVHVLITDCSKENSGKLMKQALAAEGIKCELILDLSIGFYMNSIDCVVVGANAITENGGVINRMGTYSLAIIAKCFKKPFYVLSESLKYLKLYPIDQNDIPFNKVEKEYDMIDNSSKKDEFDSEYICDYTPPDYISLYFTDEGIFTASALSDEIIQTFYNQ